MYGCESWTVKKAECWRIDAFELRCWRRLLRVPWTARRSNKSILKETTPGCSLEGLMLRLKLQCFGHLMWRVDSLEKTLVLGGIGGRRRRGQQRMRWLDGITNSMHMSVSRLRELVMDGRPDVLWFMGLQGFKHDWVTELNWTHIFIWQNMTYSIDVTWVSFRYTLTFLISGVEVNVAKNIMLLFGVEKIHGPSSSCVAIVLLF